MGKYCWYHRFEAHTSIKRDKILESRTDKDGIEKIWRYSAESSQGMKFRMPQISIEVQVCLVLYGFKPLLKLTRAKHWSMGSA